MRKISKLGIFLLLVIITIVILMGKSNALGERQVVFTADGDIFSIDIDGKNLKNLTDHPAIDGLPSPSPNGRNIAFNSWRNGDRPKIFIMDTDGKNPKLLIDDRIFDRPTWSPDSMWIAFIKEITHSIVAININSGIVKEIFKTHEIITNRTSWSPDGKKIAFRLLGVKPDEKGDIYTIDVDENLNSKNLRQLTKDPANDEYPSWSPDGKQIVFYSARDGGGIYIMDSDGANVKLIYKTEDSCCPIWSRDGKKIVFSLLRGGIFIMNSDGSEVKQIFKDGGSPSWLEIGSTFNIESEGKWRTSWGKIKQIF